MGELELVRNFLALLFLGAVCVYLYLSDAIHAPIHLTSPPLDIPSPNESPIESEIAQPEPPPPKTWTEPPYYTPVPEKYYGTANSTRRASAAIVILCRNDQIPGVRMSMALLEQRFNHKYHYPYVFLNEVPFSEEFKRNVSVATRSSFEFGLIEPDHWFQPDWIDEEKAAKARKQMKSNKVLYGDSVPYRNMCRFQSGFFFRHPLLQKYRWYWRVEPHVQFFCDIDFDPFLFMEGEDKRYAFTISIHEYKKTVRTLWPTVRDFISSNPDLIAEDNALEMLMERNKNSVTWNMCHFWSNFEIGDLELWRSDAYRKFFEFLDSKGGFYYERWGDAPVHTLGAALFLRKDQIHFFNEIGYWHVPLTHCPTGPAHARGNCQCEEKDNVDRQGGSCLNKYDELFLGGT
ncbi:Glycosyltransferase family 15 protein [Mycena chlorophos]|uniref:Glycosyltransferase family 15 protein n=1 Tax=Mycena chlorophos TaxID=658473 RepID=A0A8H6S166_MYCCL|nr:Glycosyltransferase family 15 protein [Mycena chlorophos]